MLAQSCSQMHVHSLAHVQDLIPTLAGILYIYIYIYLKNFVWEDQSKISATVAVYL